MVCQSRPIYCARCCSETHRETPFHRIQRWTGEYFKPAWLWQAGVSICLGHRGEPCPLNKDEGSEGEPMEIDNEDPESSDEEQTEHPFEYIKPGTKGRRKDLHGNPFMVVVDVSGVHHLGVRACRCSDGAELNIQLLRAGLYPATSKRPRTVFTFAVLDDYLLQNRECKTATMSYFSKLRRATDPRFPHTVLVCISMMVWQVLNADRRTDTAN